MVLVDVEWVMLAIIMGSVQDWWVKRINVYHDTSV